MKINNLPIEKSLSTDYLLIEEEHSRLKKLLTDLHDTCCNLNNELGCHNCKTEKLASCRGRLPSYTHDFIELAAEHFSHEESIMLNRPQAKVKNNYFRLHQLAHDSLMQKLNSMMDECHQLNEKNETAEGYRLFYNNIFNLLEEHDQRFDGPFINSIRI